jgi:hypothetical protein
MNTHPNLPVALSYTIVIDEQQRQIILAALKSHRATSPARVVDFFSEDKLQDFEAMLSITPQPSPTITAYVL